MSYCKVKDYEEMTKKENLKCLVNRTFVSTFITTRKTLIQFYKFWSKKPPLKTTEGKLLRFSETLRLNH